MCLFHVNIKKTNSKDFLTFFFVMPLRKIGTFSYFQVTTPSSGIVHQLKVLNLQHDHGYGHAVYLEKIHVFFLTVFTFASKKVSKRKTRRTVFLNKLICHTSRRQSDLNWNMRMSDVPNIPTLPMLALWQKKLDCYCELDDVCQICSETNLRKSRLWNLKVITQTVCN